MSGRPETGRTTNPFPPCESFQVTTPAKTALFMDGAFSISGAYALWVGEPGLMPNPVHPPDRVGRILDQLDDIKISENALIAAAGSARPQLNGQEQGW
jgi:hypothetical protein